MNAFVQGARYAGPENRQALTHNTGHVTVRIGWVYIDAMGWPRIEVDRWFLT